jgi:hypothetical protein
LMWGCLANSILPSYRAANGIAIDEAGSGHNALAMRGESLGGSAFYPL